MLYYPGMLRYAKEGLKDIYNDSAALISDVYSRTRDLYRKNTLEKDPVQESYKPDKPIVIYGGDPAYSDQNTAARILKRYKGDDRQRNVIHIGNEP